MKRTKALMGKVWWWFCDNLFIVLACAVIAGLVIELFFNKEDHEPVYPDPVCETCGQVLDGAHTPVCIPEGLSEAQSPESQLETKN